MGWKSAERAQRDAAAGAKKAGREDKRGDRTAARTRRAAAQSAGRARSENDRTGRRGHPA